MNLVLDAHYPQHPNLNTPAARLVRMMFQEGTNYTGGTYASGDVDRERLWPDAEQFIDQLDTAAAGDQQSNPGAVTKRFRHLLASLPYAPEKDVPSFREMGHAAKRLIAAECCAFMRETSPEEERWEPYRSWAEALTPHDVIVTFNYDLVLERLHLPVVDPMTSKGALDRANVLKLHGSVNWKRSKQGPMGRARYSVTEYDEFVLDCQDYEIGIATPGPSKRSIPEDLRELWDQAITALTRADAIVFVGFRFPPTDAVARSKLLAAITANKEAVNLNLHIVLGPDLGDKDVVRLRGLLESAARRAGRIDLKDYWSERGRAPGDGDYTYQITTHPLWGQDFLSVWTRDELFAQRRWG
jgi:hypothetical protein